MYVKNYLNLNIINKLLNVNILGCEYYTHVYIQTIITFFYEYFMCEMRIQLYCIHIQTKLM